MAKRSAKTSWMKRNRVWVRSHRAALVVIETVAGMAIVAGIAVAVFLWQLSKGDISVSFLTAPIERAVNAQLSGYTVKIGDTVLEKTDSAAGMSVRLRSLSVRDAAGSLVAEVPKAAVGIKVLPLFFGQVVAGSIDLIGPRLAIAYERGGQIAISLAGRAAKSPAPAVSDIRPSLEVPVARSADTANGETSAHQSIRFIKSILSGGKQGELTGLDAVGIRQAELVFVHERLGRRWELSNISFVVMRRGGNLHVSAEVDVGYAGQNVAMRGQATMSPRDGGLHVAGQFDDLVPRLLGQGFETLALLQAIDLPVGANFTGDIDDDGTLNAATFSALLGAGRLRPPGGDGGGILIDEGVLRLSYDAASRVVAIETAEFLSGRTRVAMSGSVTGPADPFAADAQKANSWLYQIEGRDVLLGSADVTAPPLLVERISVSGRYDIATGELRLDSGEFAAGAASLAVAGVIAPDEKSPMVDVHGKFNSMPVGTLKAIWPAFAAPGARDWVVENIRSAEMTAGAFSARFPSGLLARIDAGGSIPDEALQLEFSFKDLVTSYLDTMPLIRGASGQARIVGDRFVVDVGKAHVKLPSGKQLALTSGRFLVPKIADRIPRGEIAINIIGGVPELIEFLNHKPLGYPRRIGISRSDLNGHGEVAVRLELPLIDDVLLEQVRIEADAELNKLSGARIFNGRDVADGVLVINVKDETLSAQGEVLVDGRPAGISWRLPFDASESNPSHFYVSMTLNDAERRKFGLDFPYVTGPVRFRFAPEGGLGKGRKGEMSTRILADLKEASIDRTPFGWSKPSGVPGDLSFVASTVATGGYVLDKFALDSDGTKIRGRMIISADGSAKTVRFSECNLRPGDDLSLTAERVSKNEWHITLKGATFDARGLIDGIMNFNEESVSDAKPDSGEGMRIVVDAEIGRVLGHEGVVMTDARTHLISASDQISRLDIVARLQGRDNFHAVIAESDQAGARELRVDANDAGAAFRFAGFYRRAKGGTLQLRMTLPGDARAVTTGVLKASKFRIQNEPVLATINAAAGERRDQQNRAPTNGGIFFDRLRVPFERRPGMIRLGESVLRGPTVGATIGGTIDFSNHNIALEGTFIPAYLLNNLLSRVPVLGEILMGGQDEGLVALSFAITGSTDDPQVRVNPLSVVTPGVLRKIFSFGQTPVYARPGPGMPDKATGSLPRNTRPFDIR